MYCDKCHTDKEENEFDEGRAICRRCRLNALTNDLNRRAKQAARTLGNPSDSVQVLTPEDVTLLFSHYPACLKCGSIESPTYDHVNPLSLGGENVNDNGQRLCESCNKGKGDTFADYRNGDICPSAVRVPKEKDHSPDFSPVDWLNLESLYISGDMSMSELAESSGVSEPRLSKRAQKGNWTTKRLAWRRKVADSVANSLAEKAIDINKLAIETAFMVIDSFRFSTKQEATAADALNAVKLIMLAKGEPTERTETRDIGDWREIAAGEGLNPAQIAELEKAIKAKGGVGGVEDAGGLSAHGLRIDGADDRGFVA